MASAGGRLTAKVIFRNLAKGGDRAEAMRQALLAMLAERRNEEGAAHPFFWAAFVAAGDWR